VEINEESWMILFENTIIGLESIQYLKFVSHYWDVYQAVIYVYELYVLLRTPWWEDGFYIGFSGDVEFWVSHGDCHDQMTQVTIENG
jgi:hypothetical protein